VIVLVTGGAGFIGSHVVDSLCAQGHEPRIFDLLPSPFVDGDVRSVRADLLDQTALDRATKDCDAVVHLAAMADVNAVAADPGHAALVNVQGTVAALEAAHANGVGRFVYASTVWVYGGVNGNGHLLDEETPLVLPTHFYTATKLAGEMYCSSYAGLFGLQQTSLRFGIPYGPRSRPAAVVARFVALARAGQPLVVDGDGSQSRQFVYVEDLAEGVVAALNTPGASGVYNLVGEESTSIVAIAEHVRELVAAVPIEHVPGRLADLQPIQASGERAARELGWRTRTPFEAGLKRYLDWLTETKGSPSAATESRIEGSAADVRRQEPGEL
jgi:UDP-glucose 4-epimerase